MQYLIIKQQVIIISIITLYFRESLILLEVRIIGSSI